MSNPNQPQSNYESSPFYAALHRALDRRGMQLVDICRPHDGVARRVLHDYGAMFIAADGVLPPPLCIFTNEQQVAEFQRAAGIAASAFDDSVIELQPQALAALLRARLVAQQFGLAITPRDGAEAARRSYGDTVRLWSSRFLPALDHWQDAGRLSEAEVKRLQSLPIAEQVSAVLELEEDGIFFSKDFSKSILYSIAAPGSSQHIAMLAFDANEFRDARVREILAEHGWFQTVLSDLPHFTFLGLSEAELPEHGLRRVEVLDQIFWIPDVNQSPGS